MRCATTLKPGDTYERDGVTVTILREREPWRDRFGIERFRFWAKRSMPNLSRHGSRSRRIVTVTPSRFP